MLKISPSIYSTSRGPRSQNGGDKFSKLQHLGISRYGYNAVNISNSIDFPFVHLTNMYLATYPIYSCPNSSLVRWPRFCPSSEPTFLHWMENTCHHVSPPFPFMIPPPLSYLSSFTSRPSPIFTLGNLNPRSPTNQ